MTARVAVEQAVDVRLGALRRAPAARSSACSTFGASAPLKELQRKFGFTPEHIVATARAQLGLDHTPADGTTLAPA